MERLAEGSVLFEVFKTGRAETLKSWVVRVGCTRAELIRSKSSFTTTHSHSKTTGEP